MQHDSWFVTVGWSWWQAFGYVGGLLVMMPFKLAVGYWGLLRGRQLSAEETVEVTLLPLVLAVVWWLRTVGQARLQNFLSDYDARWDSADTRWYLYFGFLVGNLSGCLLTTLCMISWKTTRGTDPVTMTGETRYWRDRYLHRAGVVRESNLPGPSSGLQNVLCDGERFRGWGRSIDHRVRRILKNYRNQCAMGYPFSTGPRTILPTDSPIIPPAGFSELSPGGQLVFLCCVIGMEEFAEQDPGSSKWRKDCARCGWCRRFPEGLDAAGVCRLGCG